ncbi:MAG TPA: SPOR domain-containing protein [Thermoanaerobaculia bacterium]|nr:SPOR domain-containing protein [Thermoanaerobaculia bacterium]
MANSHEPSYYEIALTNRQVVVAFVILLICLLSAFFSGVYIGREGTLRDQEQLVRTNPPAQAPANDEGRELDEFEFFDSGNARATAPDQQARVEPTPEPPPTNSADTTLLEDFGGEEDVAPAPEEEVEEAQRPEAETPTERRIRERREREARRAQAAAEALNKPVTREATPAREETPARSRRTETATAPAASAAKGKVVIQVFSSAEKDQAERIRQRLVNGGHPAYLSPVEVGGTTMYRVRIGPYPTRADAQKVADTVRKGYKLDTWITE